MRASCMSPLIHHCVASVTDNDAVDQSEVATHVMSVSNKFKCNTATMPHLRHTCRHQNVAGGCQGTSTRFFLGKSIHTCQGVQNS